MLFRLYFDVLCLSQISINFSFFCVSGCDPELFENTLQLRERRLDLEELLVEEKKSAEALEKERDTLIIKVKLCYTSLCYIIITRSFFFFYLNLLFSRLILQGKSVKTGRKAAEADLELVNREKQQKLNELDVVIPLRLHQVNTQK